MAFIIYYNNEQVHFIANLQFISDVFRLLLNYYSQDLLFTMPSNDKKQVKLPVKKQMLQQNIQNRCLVKR
jgi:hypothetical protein